MPSISDDLIYSHEISPQVAYALFQNWGVGDEFGQKQGTNKKGDVYNRLETMRSVVYGLLAYSVKLPILKRAVISLEQHRTL